MVLSSFNANNIYMVSGVKEISQKDRLEDTEKEKNQADAIRAVSILPYL